MKKRNPLLNFILPSTVKEEGGGTGAPVENEPALDDKVKKLALSQPQVERMSEWVTQKQRTAELNEDVLERLCVLGHGNGGVVHKMRHKNAGIVLARKLVHLEVKPSILDQIIKELKILHKCNSPYIVGFYGVFKGSNDISICMEFMDGLSLDRVSKAVGRIKESRVGRVAVAVLKGLAYLKAELNILHRDIKPSNMLVNSSGEIKLCDFGVPTKVIGTAVGTVSYTAPERFIGVECSVQSDVWSFGLSLVELALGRYPIPAPTRSEFAHTFGVSVEEIDMDDVEGDDDQASAKGAKEMSLLDCIVCIVNDPPPVLPRKLFTDAFCEFVGKCLKKNPTERANHAMLMKEPFFVKHEANEDTGTFATWLRSVIET